MSGMIGADPDALERLAGDFDRGAGSLESIVLRVRTSVHANPWSGARATRFRNDWDQRHGPQLKRTALTLRTAAKQLRQQAAEQRQASSAGVGSVPGMGRLPGVRPLPTLPWSLLPDGVTPVSPLGPWDDFKEQFAMPFGLLGVLGGAATLGNNANLLGRYPHGLVGDLARSNAFFQYKRSLNGMFSVNGLGDRLDNIRGLGALGSAIGKLDLLADASRLATNPTPLGVSQTVATALKTSKNPVAYLGGMALSSVNMAAAEAGKTDWSPEAFKTTTDFVRANGPGVVVEELGKATVEVFTKRIWSIF